MHVHRGLRWARSSIRMEQNRRSLFEHLGDSRSDFTFFLAPKKADNDVAKFLRTGKGPNLSEDGLISRCCSVFRSPTVISKLLQGGQNREQVSQMLRRGHKLVDELEGNGNL